MANDTLLNCCMFGVDMKPEEVIVLRVLRFVIVAALTAALFYMAWKG